ncbi:MULTISPECIES: hypothetical protein [unclassified Streptomyces]|uniref:hypothetical protein n=1 Tax=unclassified Streptomyces TaxID=2593676 RepID=UPI000B82C8C3|nr:MULTISPECIES: hypothetical protein [unclassified Streptomyces]MYZ38007.1 hypothetical protein [Streptomyces sp. SID4917]
MTPTLRTPCAIAVASLLIAAPGAYAEESAPPVTGPTAAAESALSLAGHPAGEGRPRPGRPQEPETVSPDDGSPRTDDSGDGDSDSDSDSEADPGAEWESGWEADEETDGDPQTDTETSPAPSVHPGRPTKVPASPSDARPLTSPSKPASPSHSDENDESEEDEEDEPAGSRKDTDGTVDGTDRKTDGHAAEEPLEEFAHPPEDSEAPRRRPPAAAHESATRTVTGPAARPVPVLTLGTGITLIGLGLGFLGLRLRRR